MEARNIYIDLHNCIVFGLSREKVSVCLRGTISLIYELRKIFVVAFHLQRQKLRFLVTILNFFSGS